jgi:uncharacterized protein YdeI (YjbR/CyaY-like superfamily)
MAKVTNIDDYISKSEPFAQEILSEIRKIVHEYCPQVEEAMKWSFPNYTYKGSILCSSAAFKQHCAFGFWLESVMEDPHGIFKRHEGGMGSLGKITSMKDLPPRNILGEYILQAMDLVDAGVKLKKAPTEEKKKELEVPKILLDELEKDAIAKSVFENFSYSHKKEYVEWLNGAKTETTMLRRLETTLSNLREGKSKEWKYQK